MEYEVRRNDRAVGTLHVGTEGLMTVFEARTLRLEGIQRLWVCGEDRCSCLGVLMPAGAEMCLRKKLSRRDMLDFPKKILYAAAAEKKTDMTPLPNAAPADEPPEGPTAESPPQVKTPDEENGPVWHSARMGSLTAVIDGVIYTAIPAMLRRTVPGVHIMTINGTDYIIFRRSY